MFPNNSRPAWVTAETGFHSATALSTVGRLLDGTKGLAMNVSGKITMNDALLITSGLGTMRPTRAMIQDLAYADNSRKPNATRASIMPLWIRHPTIRPERAIISSEAA